MSIYKTCQKAVWREQREHCNIMIPNIQERHVILLSAEFCCVLKGLENKAKERNSLTTSVTSTESVWIEISSLKRRNEAESVSPIVWLRWVHWLWYAERNQRFQGQKKQLYCNYPHAAGQMSHWNMNRRLNFCHSVQITGPEEHHSLGLDSEQSAGLGSKPRYSDSMILKI